MAEIVACDGDMNGIDISEALSKRFPEGLTIDSSAPKRIFAHADSEKFLEIVKYMKDELGFDHSSLVTGMDMGDRIQVIHHLTSYSNNCCLMEIIVDLDRDNPEIDSITPLYGGANYTERETYDMLGIVFKDHPNLKRIFLPEDTKFYPLRKDFKIKEGP